MLSTLNEIGKNEKEQVVTIKLEKEQAEYLLEAARLGLIAGSWCTNLSYSYVGFTPLDWWVLSVDSTINKIKEQTDIRVEDPKVTSYGWVQDIEDLVNKKCEEFERKNIESESEFYSDEMSFT